MFALNFYLAMADEKQKTFPKSVCWTEKKKKHNNIIL